MSDVYINQVNKVFNDLKDRFKPDQKLMMAIAVHLRECAKANILNEGADLPVAIRNGAAHTNFWPVDKMFRGKQLIKSGGLLRSIQASATNTTSMASTNRQGAALMHFGGEVKAKKILGSVKRHRDVWAMEQYFWRQWYLSNKKEKNWMILALHMQKHNSITVQARPFMVLTEPYYNRIVETIQKHVLK